MKFSNVLVRVSLTAALLACVPLVALMCGYAWNGDVALNEISWIDYVLFIITQSATAPIALATCVLFVIIFAYMLRKQYSSMLVCAMCFIGIMLPQGIKSIAKVAFAEPRPFVVAMAKDIADSKERFGDIREILNINKTSESSDIISHFYALPKEMRANVISAYYNNTTHTLIVKHRADESGYSFPSGHSTLAASLLFLCIGFFAFMRTRVCIALQVVLTIWTLLVMTSRLRLGMHYPIDLCAGISIAYIIVIALFWCLFYYKDILETLCARITQKLFNHSKT